MDANRGREETLADVKMGVDEPCDESIERCIGQTAWGHVASGSIGCASTLHGAKLNGG